ncbi:hypothetical protein AYI69_g1587 [Smittium culicis]|uniref:Uncharacterized protein n=1 Tax=Smittium culicis TaxID=133412 RepID=A0A1R1YPV0_9FUNG|nr:hypothetical protein AYI69_g7549 [Smittium culicis]OMJ28921.1 hypothetical protein AYI69_g1587 [Smittium culicis]
MSSLNRATSGSKKLAESIRGILPPAKPAESAKERAKRILNSQKLAIVEYEHQQVEIEDTIKNLSTLFTK